MTKKVQFRDNPDTIVQLCIGDLNDLVFSVSYRAARRANDQMYNGLVSSYLNRLEQDNNLLLNELEELRVKVNMLVASNSNSNEDIEKE